MRRPATCCSKPVLPRTTRFLALDSLRGICALLVALHNLEYPHAWSFIQHSSLFVDFFFVLSGFVISHAYMRQLEAGPEVGGFMIRRFGRLWPLHVSVLGFLIVLECAKPVLAGLLHLSFNRALLQPPNSAAEVLKNLTLIQSIGIETSLSWNVPSWSISTEFWTYGLFAGLCWVFGGRPALYAAIGIALCSVIFLGFTSPAFLESNTYCAILRCIYGFFIGHLTYRAWEYAGSIRRPVPVAEILVIAMVILFVSEVGPEPLSLAAPLLFAATVWIFASGSGPLSTLLKTPVLVHLGIWSYSIYMVHWLVRTILFEAVKMGTRGSLPQMPDGLNVLSHVRNYGSLSAIIIGYLVMVIGISAITFNLIEQPARRHCNKLAAKFSRDGLKGR